MFPYVVALCSLLLAFHHPAALAANNIGCLFSDTLCELDREWCYDDQAFGHCLPDYGHYNEDDLYRYELGSEELRVLEQEMQRLFLLGYRWSHTYTQCVLQNLLKSIRRGKEFDISSCNDNLDQDLEGALRAIEGEELVDPRDLAIVRFTPSATDPHSDYADEVYFPPIKDPHASPPQPGPEQDGEERSEEDGGEGDGGGGSEEGEEEGEGGEGGRGGGDEDNSLSPIPSHPLSQSPPPPEPPPHSNHEEDDRARNYISYYDDPGYQNDVYQSPYDYQHNPVFGKRSSFHPRPGPGPGPNQDPDQSSNVNYLPFLQKLVDDFSDGKHATYGQYIRQPNPPDDEGVFGEAPARPVYTEGGMQYIPQLEREHEMFGPDEDEVDNEGGIWTNSPGNLRANPVGISGFGNQQALSGDPRNLQNFGNQQNMAGMMRNIPRELSRFGEQHYIPEGIRGFGEQQNIPEGPPGWEQQTMPEGLRGFEEQRNIPEVLRGFAGQQNIPGGLRSFGEQRNIPEGLRGFREQQNMPGNLRNIPGNMGGFGEQRVMSENLRNVPGDPRTLTVDMSPLGEQRYLPGDIGNYGYQQEPWSYQNDAQNFRNQQEDVWNYPSIMRQREPSDLGLRDTRPSFFEDLQNYGEQRNQPEELRNTGGDGMYSSWNTQTQPRYNNVDLSRFSPLMMVSDEDVITPEDKNRLSGYQSLFESQINQLADGGYGRDLADYPDYQDYRDYNDYQDYQDYDSDPRQLTQKFVKKDEETVGSDYGDTLPGWNLPRTERLDVKKPGPYYYNSKNAFAYPQLDFAFLSQRRPQQQQMAMTFQKIMYSNMREGERERERQRERELGLGLGLGLGEEGLQVLPFPPDEDDAADNDDDQEDETSIPDVVLAEEGLVMDEAPRDEDKQVMEEPVEEEKEEGKDKEKTPEIEKDKEKKEGEDDEEEVEAEGKEKEGGGGEGEGEGGEKEASPSPKPPDLVEITVKQGLTRATGSALVRRLAENAGLQPTHITDVRVEGNKVAFVVRDNNHGVTAGDLARAAEEQREDINKDLDMDIVQVAASHQINAEPIVGLPPADDADIRAKAMRQGGVGRHVMAAAAVVCGVAAAVAVAAGVLFLLRRHANTKAKLPLLASPHTQDSKDYEDLCRARMAGKGSGGEGGKGGDSTPAPSSGHPPSQRVSSLSRDSDNGNNSPSSRSSTSSWSEEPVASNMDISTGHMVLSYMEDHLKNKDRLEQEWIALCAYEAEPCATTLALKPENNQKNRYPDAVPYDHNRVNLNAHANISGSDYINASSITDHDPRNPAYIATQGPLETTAADFWQLVWEQGSVVIVMLTRLTENGHSFCYRYWPEEGSDLYHIYEVHLVSEHIWCDDYLVRSFYLKNVRTGETRTVTQFHFLSWHESGTPASTKALLEFRRKVNKSYRGRSCPIIVHCSDGIGRTGTYSLIDMVLNRMAKGAKEIDIAATLEHIRDQRPHMVRSKAQFEFVLMAVAEEVHAILKALPQ